MSTFKHAKVDTVDMFTMGWKPSSGRCLSITKMGHTIDINMSKNATIGEVIDAINNAWAKKVSEAHNSVQVMTQGE